MTREDETTPGQIEKPGELVWKHPTADCTLQRIHAVISRLDFTSPGGVIDQLKPGSCRVGWTPAPRVLPSARIQSRFALLLFPADARSSHRHADGADCHRLAALGPWVKPGA